MKLSIITPLYKGKKYIPDVIKMVEANASEVPEIKTELIFVNDFPEESISEEDVKAAPSHGSSDREENNLNAASIDIRLLTNPVNQGIHQSRVNGLKAATGDYIMFFDQDDKITDDYLKTQLNSLLGTNYNKPLDSLADIVIGNGIAEYPTYDKTLYRYYPMQWTAKYIWFYAKFDCRIISPGQCLIKRTSIPEAWTENIMQQNGSDDYFLWLVMLTAGANVALNRNQIYTHVYTEQNTSLDNEKMYASVDEVLAIADNYKKSTGKDLIKPSALKLIRERNSGDHKKSALVKMVEKANGAK